MKSKPIDQTSVQTHGIKKSVKFGIKSSGLAHIFNVLRNQLYSDKILAVIREYSCNAYDAHIEAGKPDEAIVVTLPNRMSPLFKVRDYGLGLSDEEIQDVYAFYGESTKRNTNDQIGQLGLGSKSAFAYGDNFVINSFLGGKKHSHNAFIDPSQIGQISKLSVEDTSEKDGVEIIIPVHEGDFDEFTEKAIKLFKYFKPKPIVHGLQSNHEWKAIIENESKDALFKGEDWTWNDTKSDRYNRGDAVAIMGNIGYPIDEYSLNLKNDDHDLRQLLTENLLLHVPIGDLEISASREKLQYTEFTRKNLIKLLKRAREELASKIGEGFTGCKTLFEARCLHGATFRTDSPLYQLKDVIKEFLVWKGEVIDGSTFVTYNNSGVDLREFKKAYKSGRYKASENSSIHCEKNTVVIENDIGHRRGLMGKVLPLILTEEKKPYLIEFQKYSGSDNGKPVNRTAKQVKAKWLKDEKFDGELLKLSELPQHKLSEFGYVNNSGGGTYAGKDEKHSAKCFEYDFDAETSSWDRKKSNWWKIADVDVKNDTGVYVIIDQFKIEQGCQDEYPHYVEPNRVKNWKSTFEQVGLKFPKNIYAFKVKEREKIEGKDGWTDLFSWVKQQLESAIDNDNLHQAWIDIQNIDTLHRGNHSRSRYSDNDSLNTGNDVFKCWNELALAVTDGEFGVFLSKYNEMRQGDKIRTKIKSIQQVSSEFDVEFNSPKGVKPSYDIEKEVESVYDKYSMLHTVDNGVYSWQWNKENKKYLENYINVIDVCERTN